VVVLAAAAVEPEFNKLAAAAAAVSVFKAAVVDSRAADFRAADLAAPTELLQWDLLD